MTGHHRAPTPPKRLRYDKVAALLLASGVTAFALVSGIGEAATGGTDDSTTQAASPARAATAVDRPTSGRSTFVADQVGTQQQVQGAQVPAASGSGRRVVFDISAQRVWLVGADDEVLRSYLVSGSVTDNLGPGHYEVYSRSRHAVGVDDSGTMQYFVRFTRGKNAAIGFHDIPVDDGRKVQTVAQLGQPTSHGCIRQKPADAKRMWAFADLGTKVDVVA